MTGSRLQQRVEMLLKEAFEKRPDLFPISLKVESDQSIRIILDGDSGVNLQDCIEISRAVEHQLDREEFDFSLEVSSAGATAPLELPRQYRKNLGRTLEVKTEELEVKGTLEAVSASDITLSWKTREPKPIGKGKHTVRKEEVIPFSEIEKAKVVLKF
ncbi:ribosome assembly cofactor RimP [Robiginitalea aurantiaca]|uniref:Ribosome maturation factor RimP n=1 Tax=Robiginitalea aurantiaca TaxID=3056915 RepID=A0ABT7WBW2_9FLAO|nr:ribosome assembly cofactor RimP [Robiginitalea aurantiaca]MDM9630407.1 ribosome assembly cofactor RimP [Robiginitalea aurantiaca]